MSISVCAYLFLSMLPIVDHYLRRKEEESGNSSRLILRRKILRSNSEPFALPEERFTELFRLNKSLTENLISSLEPYLNSPRYRSGISIQTKVLAALRFYATGCYQRSIGEDYHLGLSQTSVHRCIHEVTSVISIYLAPIYIKFPRCEEFLDKKEQFMRKFQMPGTIGAIDCTHISILKPTVDEHNFINRKGYHSLNVQLICDAHLIIMNVNANYPGSTHDAFIWRQSRIRDYLHGLYVRGNRGNWLIGDSGYPLEPYLMTPFPSAISDATAEGSYNRCHIRARDCIERCIGLLKARFRCILKERTARYSPNFVGSLVNCCAVLHNMCVSSGIQFAEEFGTEEPPAETHHSESQASGLLQEGQLTRNNIVNRYFRS